MNLQTLPEFRLARPSSYAQAAALLASVENARLLAGGTDLITNLRHGLETPGMLIDLSQVAGADELVFDSAMLSLGGGATLARLACEPRIASDYAALGEAAVAAAGPAHRSVATLGGNLCLDTRCVFYNQSAWWRQANDHCLKRGGSTCHVAPQGQHCHAAFSGDLAPALIALDADVEWLSERGLRRVALADCYRDDGADHLVRACDEVLVRVLVPAPAAGRVSAYRKARVRGAMDFPLAGVAVALRMEAGAIAELRIALTGTNSRPFLLHGSETLLGRPLDEAGLAALARLVHKQVSPMRTTASQSNHRRLVAGVFAQRLLRELIDLAEKRERHDL